MGLFYFKSEEKNISQVTASKARELILNIAVTQRDIFVKLRFTFILKCQLPLNTFSICLHKNIN